MPYDRNHPPARRPSGRRDLVIAVTAAVPAALAGWFAWQAVSGPGDGAPVPSGATSSSASPVAGEVTPRTDGRGPLSGKVVVIDPGHNPRNYRHTEEISRLVPAGTGRKKCDTTGTATNAGYPEARFTLDVARRVRAVLRKQGATVKLTHDDERPFGPCVDERARTGNTARADAAVSVHADGAAPGARGFHVILPGRVKGPGADTTPIVAPSRDLGRRILGAFARSTGTSPADYIGDGGGLDTRTDLGGLNLSAVPKVFVECGNMRDAQDAALLTNAAWRQKAAQGLADGIRAYLTSARARPAM